jgi:hypothetical protein
MVKNNKEISKKEEKTKQDFFNTTTLCGQEKTSEDFEKFLFQIEFKRVQKIINRKKKTEDFDVVMTKYLEMKSKVGGL